MSAKVIVVLCSAVGLFFSCAKYIEPIPPAVPDYWLGFKQNSDDTIAVRNGYAYLRTHYNPSSANGTLLLSQNKLKGDFELKIDFSSFVPNGTNSYSDQLNLSLVNANATAVISTSLTNDKLYLQDSSTTTQSKNTYNRKGAFYVKRTGSDFYTWVNADADSLFINKSNYFSGDLNVQLQVLSNDNTTSYTSVHIDKVSVTGGNEALPSGDFNANTIRVVQ